LGPETWRTAGKLASDGWVSVGVQQRCLSRGCAATMARNRVTGWFGVTLICLLLF
jgi:hypothetical protein